mmetsp:Transcript_1070/g.2385  ORF Transcript_1070/g.2385 Transcript_1070/m.2385 type:complete len:280 (-) Transcript_1070:1905-2744(-)
MDLVLAGALGCSWCSSRCLTTYRGDPAAAFDGIKTSASPPPQSSSCCRCWRPVLPALELKVVGMQGEGGVALGAGLRSTASRGWFAKSSATAPLPLTSASVNGRAYPGTAEMGGEREAASPTLSLSMFTLSLGGGLRTSPRPPSHPDMWSSCLLLLSPPPPPPPLPPVLLLPLSWPRSHSCAHRFLLSSASFTLERLGKNSCRSVRPRVTSSVAPVSSFSSPPSNSLASPAASRRSKVSLTLERRKSTRACSSSAPSKSALFSPARSPSSRADASIRME